MSVFGRVAGGHLRFACLLLFAACSALQLPSQTPAVPRPIRIVAISDLNGSLGNPNYTPRLIHSLETATGKNPDVIIGVGDYIAGGDSRNKFPDQRFQEMWSAFKTDILGHMQHGVVEFAPSPGNHDAPGYPSMKRERDFYADFWRNHKPRLAYVSDEHYPFYYSYMVDDVFLISMDNVTPFSITHGETQRVWIKKQLATQKAKQARARIAYGHIPLYPLLDKKKHSRGKRGKYYEILSREHLGVNPTGLEAIFLDGNLNLAVFAHSHAYFPGTVVHKQGGKVRKLRILSMPCSGPGARYLSGQSERSLAGFVTIDIASSGNISTAAFNHHGDLIDKSKLPERIIVPGKFNRYFRDDKVPADLHRHFREKPLASARLK